MGAVITIVLIGSAVCIGGLWVIKLFKPNENE